MNEKMQAGVLHSPGEIIVEQVEVPRPESNGALVKVAACGICGSDIGRMLHKGSHRLPLICGHEFSGHIVELGAGVHDVVVGDLVAVPPMIPCFACDPCQRGTFSLCENYDYFGSRRDGAYAQYVCVPQTNLLKMPADLDPRAAAMLDPAAIALHALRRTKLRAGIRVAVVGAGPIGLFAAQWAMLSGAKQVVTVDLNKEKADMAMDLGVDAAATSPQEAAELAGDGFDLVFESAGSPPAVDMAVSLAGRHGEVTFVGIPNAPVTLSEGTFNRFLRLEISLHGAWNSFSAPFPGEEWHTAAQFMADGRLRWKSMITHELQLDALPETMAALGDRSIFSSKILFLPNAG
ncbi:MAG TPA: galactitol-1-phosphate 5-dehydrogenase [Nocardioidaceae bacterium]|nr:galactitol-1-phosphate 5-dehydrogenase [Nocardioidaceae bacterium]